MTPKTETEKTHKQVAHDKHIAQQKKNKRNKTFLIILIAFVALGSWYGYTKYEFAKHHAETDDAQVEANISPVIPRVSGYVTSVKVKDNQQVKKGDTLVILDDRDLRLKLNEAEASLATAQSNLAAAKANTGAVSSNITTSQAAVQTADAQIQAAKINVWRTTQDLQRYENLIKDHSITQQQYEQAQAAKQQADRQLEILTKQKQQASAQTGVASSQSHASASQIGVAESIIKQKQVDVENAKLNLSYTVVTAAEDGLVSKINVQEGQFVQPGQMLFSVVLSDDVWIVANFKETQLNKMKEGEKVTVHADAFTGHDFEAIITSFSPATGAKFSLLPPDNATGNFVKVVQRLPVKIEFTNKSDSLVKKMRPGMNVTVDVHLD
jgi:membrane fusion protein, multidrug efflux system